MPFEAFLGQGHRGQIMSKRSYTCIELVRAITCTFMHGFKKIAQL